MNQQQWMAIVLKVQLREFFALELARDRQLELQTSGAK